MDMQPTDLATAQELSNSDVTTDGELEDELLIEEISIDGMCGVY